MILGTRSSAELRNDSFSNSGMERITAVSEKGQSKSGIATMIPAPNCWKTVYYLLDLYATQPDTKTIPHRYCLFILFILFVKGKLYISF